MNKRQKAILLGMILGDAYLQKTGKRNARIRLEQSQKQQEYLLWKVEQFPEFFQGKPTVLSRYNAVYGKTYRYIRWQSYASPEIGAYQRLFYRQGTKIIPENLSDLLVDPYSIAVWYMDDGYLYHRDKVAYLYLPRYTEADRERLHRVLRENFQLQPTIKIKKKGNCVFVFSVRETKKLLTLITPYIIPYFHYKLLDPVSTEA